MKLSVAHNRTSQQKKIITIIGNYVRKLNTLNLVEKNGIN